uniref:Uncharacterized protein n=1 Tax=Serinus canaria TaxID=9135 RepID=A0A8C9KSQ7_SERCA
PAYTLKDAQEKEVNKIASKRLEQQVLTLKAQLRDQAALQNQFYDLQNEVELLQAQLREKAKLACLTQKCQERNSFIRRMHDEFHRKGFMNSALDEEMKSLVNDMTLAEYTVAFTPVCDQEVSAPTSVFAIGFIHYICSDARTDPEPFERKRDSAVIQCLAFFSSVKNFESCSQRKNWFIILLRTLFFVLFFFVCHLYMKLQVKGIELLQLGDGMPQLQLQWGSYGHHQVTRAQRPRQTSVLCLFSLIFIPIKILNHKDDVMQHPLSLELLFRLFFQGSALRHDQSLLSLWLYFAD